MRKSRIKRLEARVDVLEKALAIEAGMAKKRVKKEEPGRLGIVSGSSELDWDTALRRIKEANRSDGNRS